VGVSGGQRGAKGAPLLLCFFVPSDQLFAPPAPRHPIQPQLCSQKSEPKAKLELKSESKFQAEPQRSPNGSAQRERGSCARHSQASARKQTSTGRPSARSAKIAPTCAHLFRAHHSSSSARRLPQQKGAYKAVLRRLARTLIASRWLASAGRLASTQAA